MLRSSFIILSLTALLTSGLTEKLSAAEPSSSNPSLPMHGLVMGDATGVGAMLQFTPVASEPMACRHPCGACWRRSNRLWPICQALGGPRASNKRWSKEAGSMAANDHGNP
jgi:hypothetical protein